MLPASGPRLLFLHGPKRACNHNAVPTLNPPLRRPYVGYCVVSVNCFMTGWKESKFDTGH